MTMRHPELVEGSLVATKEKVGVLNPILELISPPERRAYIKKSTINNLY